MPRFKRWTTGEKTNAAKAYKLVTLDPVKGADQTKESYEFKIQDVPSDGDVMDLSSLSEGSPGETDKKSSERGGKGAKAAKALLARAARRGAREEALERHFERDDEHFHIIQSNIQNMERSIGMLNQQLKRKADVMVLKAKLEVLKAKLDITDDEEARAELKRKICEI
jgi:hypothetical protein